MRILQQRLNNLNLGNGIRVEKGGEIFSQWAGAKESPELARQPRFAIEFLTRYFRYAANLAFGQAGGQIHGSSIFDLIPSVKGYHLHTIIGERAR